MESGKLNKRITIQRRINSPDDEGYVVDSWEDIKTIWASMITTGGGEFYAAQKIHAETNVVFNVRFISILTTQNRIKWGNHYYEVLALNPVGGGITSLLISAKEVTDSG